MIDRKKYKTTGEYFKAKYGEDYYRKNGKKGGSAKVPKGFAINRELASKAGKIGGKIGGKVSAERRKLKREGK